MENSQTQEVGRIYVPKVLMTKILIVIKGMTALLCSNWQTKHGEIRNCRIDPKVFGEMTPAQQFKQALCLVDGREKWSDKKQGKYGMPGYYVKLACLSLTKGLKDWDLRDLIRGALFIPEDVAPITRAIPEPYTTNVNIAARGSGRKMIEKTRARYPKGWEMVINAELDESLLTPDQLAAVIDRAGRAIGIGEWRPEKQNGKYGVFKFVEIRI